MSQRNENQENQESDGEAPPNFTVVTVKMKDPLTGEVEKCHYGPASSESKKRILQICRDDAKTCYEEQNKKLKSLQKEKTEIEKKIGKVTESLVRYNRQNLNISHSLNVNDEQAEEQPEEQ